MKILIIGFGKIGLSHLKALIQSKKKIQIDIFSLKYIVKLYSKIHTISYLNKIRESTYDLIILSNTSDTRSKVLKKILEKCNYKFILIEKFIFSKISHYNKKFFNKNIYVNCWGTTLYNIIKNELPVNIISIDFEIYEGGMATTLLHFIDFFRNFSNIEKKIKINGKIKIIKSKRKKFFELVGSLNFLLKNKKLNIRTNQKLNKSKTIKLKIISPNKINYVIIQSNKKKIIFKKKNSKMIYSINKLFVKETTFQVLKNLNKIHMTKNFPKYDNMHNICINILQFLKKKFKKEIKIT